MNHPLAERILLGNVPEAAKRAAAKGALPIPREDLIELWVCLRNDADPEVRIACKESLGEVQESEWLELLPEQEFRPEVFDFAVRVLGRNRKVLQAALRNRHIPNASVKWAAANTEGVPLDMILDNQERLIHAPEIVSALLSNPKIDTGHVRRVYDLAEQFFRDNGEILSLLAAKFNMRIGAAGGVFAGRRKAPEGPPVLEEAGETPPEPRTDPVEETSQEGEEEGEEFPPELLEDLPAAEETVKTLYQQILTMPVAKKIELALKGNKEARTLLIKDPNKVVQEAVLDSSRITEREVENISRMRNVPVDILRKIARNNNWMKIYTVRKSLATNSKTPLTISIRLIDGLTDSDLRMVQKDRMVSEVVRREAKKVFEKRHQRKALFKK